jgi:hypothetical protein
VKNGKLQYAIKLINLMWPDNAKRVEEERGWQIACLNGIYEEIERMTKHENYTVVVLKDNCRLHIEMNVKSQTLMYLSSNQRVREIGLNANGNNVTKWVQIQTKTKRTADQWGSMGSGINGVRVIDYCSFCISPICDPLLGPRV